MLFDDLELTMYLILFAFAALIIFIIYLSEKSRKEMMAQRERVRNKLKAIVNNSGEITPEEFLKLRNTREGNTLISSKYNFPGVYVIYNRTKNMYYVGQGQRVFDRVNNHFTGKGNGDVYADYKYGDKFTIRMLSLNNTGYYSLNELEKALIDTYDAYASGYNKTRGNR